MQSTETPETNRTPEVAPAIRHVVPWRVVTVEVLADLRLKVGFVDGTDGEVHLADFLHHPKVDGTSFEALRVLETFSEARVVMGAVAWPSGAELAPDAMYDAIRQHGRWVLD